MKDKTYRGRGTDEITEIIKNTGTNLEGQIVRATGEHIANVEFALANGDLYLTVDGTEYTSITNALHEMAPELATHDAEGSEGSGNVANNVIGNYAILKHVLFGGRSMYDMLGGSNTTKTVRIAKAKAKAVRVVLADPKTTPAQNNLYNYFKRDDIIAIAKRLGGAEPFQAAIKGLTVNEFAQKFEVSF
jgi:hypothetical protein